MLAFLQCSYSAPCPCSATSDAYLLHREGLGGSGGYYAMFCLFPLSSLCLVSFVLWYGVGTTFLPLCHVPMGP